jgi:hypothetical protein
MSVHELQRLKIGDFVKNTNTNEKYEIIMKFQFSANCFLGSGTNGHTRISELNAGDFEIVSDK